MILEQVDYEIQISKYKKKLIAGIALTGGGAQLKNIKELCELITATDTRIGIPTEHIDPSSASFDELAHPMYATGIGLVLYGIEKAEQERDGIEDVIVDEDPGLVPGDDIDDKKDTTKDDGHVDIFKDMDKFVPADEPKPEPKKEEKPQKPKKNRKGVFDIRLKQYFDKVFGETGIDD